MKMQFTITSKAQSREVQEALFAAGYEWCSGDKKYLDYGDKIWINTAWSDNLISYQSNKPMPDLDTYVVVDGEIYKEGEEPKLLKKGTKVKCIRPTTFSEQLKMGYVYTVSEDQDRPHRVDIEEASEWFNRDRFELVQPEPVMTPFIEAVGPRPPLGLSPRSFVDEDRTNLDRERLIEVLAATVRYSKAGMPVPKEWHEEFRELSEVIGACSQ